MAERGSARDRVSDETEVELVVKHVGDRVSRNHEKERMAVGGRSNDRLGGDVARSARPVLDEQVGAAEVKGDFGKSRRRLSD